MRRRSPLFTLLITLLTLLVVAGGFTSFQRKRSSFERLDFEFRWKKGVILVDRVEPGSGAERSGLRRGDEIWVVGGMPAAEVEGIKKTIRNINEPIPIVVARANKTLTLTYSPPELRIDYGYLYLTLIGFLYLVIGLYTAFRGNREESLLFYFASLLSFIVYVYSPAGRIDTTFKVLSLIEEFGRIFLPPLALHFFLRFPRPLVSRRWLTAAIYLPPILLALWNLDLYAFGNRIRLTSVERAFALIDRWEMAHFAIYFSLALIALIYTYRTASAIGQRKQIKWIYLGIAFGFTPFLLFYLIPFIRNGAGPVYTNFAILPLALIPLAFAVSILRYKLWDVEVIMKEILAYTVTLVIGMIGFSTVNILLSRLIEERLAMERNFLAFTSGLLIAGVLIPVKGKIEAALEMLLYRETYRHRKAITGFAQELATFHDHNDLIEMIRERLASAIGVHRLNLYLRDAAQLLLFDEERGLPRRVSESDFGNLPPQGPMFLNEARLPEASEVPMTLVRSGYRYLFPLRHRGELQGVLLCGGKSVDEPLSRDDLHLIGSLTAPLALALENARLYGRLRRQLDEIRSLKEYNENIIESSSSAILVVADDGTVLTGNRAFWELLGDDELHGSIDTILPSYSEVRKTPGVSVETTLINTKGELKEVTLSTNPFGADDVPFGTTVVVVGDISERVRLERELQEKERLASLGLLAAGVAHEVNTPLTGISSYAQLLLADTSPDDPRYKILRKMEQQTFRASHLVNNLLDFAARRHGTVERVPLAEVVDSTLTLHGDLLEGKKVTLHLSDMPSVSLRGNMHEIQQVLTNLLLNARDAVPTGGNIWIDAREQDGNIVITIRDDGSGISSSMHEEIFKPLVTTKRNQGGTGLGLAIVQRIVHGLGGKISLVSVPGEGATFSVSLPLWNEEGAN